MNEVLSIAGGILLFLVSFFVLHPESRKNILGNVFLFFVVGIFGTVALFQESIGAKVLETHHFEGQIERPIAEAFVGEKFGGEALYSWYGVEHFQPAIFVMLQKEEQQKKVVLNAFSGIVIDAHLTPTSNLSFDDFVSQSK